jgi:hypothetical protein
MQERVPLSRNRDPSRGGHPGAGRETNHDSEEGGGLISR